MTSILLVFLLFGFLSGGFHEKRTIIRSLSKIKKTIKRYRLLIL